ncbi:MAG: hypothetical protein WCP16_25255 [Pseudanabaena sp. ELA645]|jgi:hypothetical protein
MRLSSIGLIGGALLIGAVSATPSFASTPTSISGSATFISPAGFTSTVSGESVLPSGFNYNTGAALLTTSVTPGVKATLTNAAAIALPQFSLQGFSIAAESLQVASTATVTAVTSPTSFNVAAATVLTNAAAATSVGVNNTTLLTDGRTTVVGAVAGTPGTVGNIVYASANIDFISAIIKAGAGVNGLD